MHRDGSQVARIRHFLMVFAWLTFNYYVRMTTLTNLYGSMSTNSCRSLHLRNSLETRINQYYTEAIPIPGQVEGANIISNLSFIIPEGVRSSVPCSVFRNEFYIQLALPISP